MKILITLRKQFVAPDGKFYSAILVDRLTGANYSLRGIRVNIPSDMITAAIECNSVISEHVYTGKNLEDVQGSIVKRVDDWGEEIPVPVDASEAIRRNHAE